MIESIGPIPESFIRHAVNWSRGTDIRVLSAEGVQKWRDEPLWREEQKTWARQNTAEEKVSTEIRALDAEGVLLYATDTKEESAPTKTP